MDGRVENKLQLYLPSKRLPELCAAMHLNTIKISKLFDLQQLEPKYLFFLLQSTMLFLKQ